MIVEIIRFIFGSFWTWLGALVLVTAAGRALSKALRGFVTLNITINRNQP
jgi:hypothetical protein